MDEQIRRELRALKLYGITAALLLATVALSAFQQATRRERFGEIDVERINVIERDGTLRLVLTNRSRAGGGEGQGRSAVSRPGIVFFNDEGVENGGLSFEGRRLPDGSVSAATGMAFERFGQEPVVRLSYTDEAGRRHMGLTIGERPDTHRVYVGRDDSRAAVLNLSDAAGRPRLRLRVDSLGAASLEFLDEHGRVLSRLPETGDE